VAGRKLVLGGVHVPYEKGLEGHSDGDALSHAVMDALLVFVFVLLSAPDLALVARDDDAEAGGVGHQVIANVLRNLLVVLAPGQREPGKCQPDADQCDCFQDSLFVHYSTLLR
jgi:2-C-methyl-D-erythritol 2,4-cyclodiphosphate synthase